MIATTPPGRELSKAARPAQDRHGARARAGTLASLVPAFVCFLFFQRLLIEGIATTGLKR